MKHSCCCASPLHTPRCREHPYRNKKPMHVFLITSCRTLAGAAFLPFLAPSPPSATTHLPSLMLQSSTQQHPWQYTSDHHAPLSAAAAARSQSCASRGSTTTPKWAAEPHVSAPPHKYSDTSHLQQSGSTAVQHQLIMAVQKQYLMAAGSTPSAIFCSASFTASSSLSFNPSHFTTSLRSPLLATLLTTRCGRL